MSDDVDDSVRTFTVQIYMTPHVKAVVNSKQKKGNKKAAAIPTRNKVLSNFAVLDGGHRDLLEACGGRYIKNYQLKKGRIFPIFYQIITTTKNPKSVTF
jgi:hypothetical protein